MREHVWKVGSLIGVAAVAASMIGCEDKNASSTVESTIPSATSSSPTSSVETQQTNQLFTLEQTMQRFYPEGIAAGLKGGTFLEIGGATPTTIYNFTNKKINQEAALATYQILNKFWSLDTPFATGIEHAGKLYDFYALPTQSTKDLVQINVLLLPESSLPPHASAQAGFIDAGTTFDQEGYVFSFVRVTTNKTAVPFTEPDQYATLRFSVEVCQELISVGYSETGSSHIANDGSEIAAIGQELFCNSNGAALAARSLGISYENYSTNVGTHSISGKPFIVMPQGFYESFPITGPILKETD